MGFHRTSCYGLPVSFFCQNAVQIFPAIFGVAALAKKYGKRVLPFSGCVAEDAGICNEHGNDAFFPILRGVATLNEACRPENARRNMIATVEQVFRLIRCYL